MMARMIKVNYRRHHGHGRKRKRKRDYCDGCGDFSSCSGPNCDGPDCCNFGLFSFMLTLGATTARVAPVPLVDRAGRAAILGYRRWLSHRWPGQCRFTPTCSAYGLTAVERYGLAVGGRMAADRLRRCRPDVPRGTADPVR